MNASRRIIALNRHHRRWYKLKDHPVQIALINAIKNGIRFPVVPAGRRSGKTERFKRFVVKQANAKPGMYFAGAPTYNQAKKIFWKDLKDLCYSTLLNKRPSESDLIIYLDNGSEIHVIGFDKPERFEGIPWTGGGIDEFGNTKPDAWKENILPALNTVNPTDPDYRAWCWVFGVPEGLNHYYDIACDAEKPENTEYALFHWKSSEILPQDVIDAAKKTLSPRQFRQEYEASFEGATLRVYEDYSKENYTTETIKSHELLHWMHDQNYTPLSSAIGVVRENKLYLLDEIVLESAISRQSALEFVEKYREHQNKTVYIYGDPSGRNGEKHGHASDYTDIEEVLRDNGWAYVRKVKSSHPAIKDRQNCVRAMILNASGDRRLFVNPSKAEYCDKGLATVQTKKGSTFLEEESDYQHITTAIGYMVDVVWPVNKKSFFTSMSMGH